jgi:hypothetical protein
MHAPTAEELAAIAAAYLRLHDAAETPVPEFSPWRRAARALETASEERTVRVSWRASSRLR